MRLIGRRLAKNRLFLKQRLQRHQGIIARTYGLTAEDLLHGAKRYTGQFRDLCIRVAFFLLLLLHLLNRHKNTSCVHIARLHVLAMSVSGTRVACMNCYTNYTQEASICQPFYFHYFTAFLLFYRFSILSTILMNYCFL